jgi:hypothetical protein
MANLIIAYILMNSVFSTDAPRPVDGAFDINIGVSFARYLGITTGVCMIINVDDMDDPHLYVDHIDQAISGLIKHHAEGTNTVLMIELSSVNPRPLIRNIVPSELMQYICIYNYGQTAS